MSETERDQVGLAKGARKRLLISGSKVRVLDGPPIESGTPESAECPIWLFGSFWFQIWFQIGPETASAADVTAAVTRSSRSTHRRPLFGIQRA